MYYTLFTIKHICSVKRMLILLSTVQKTRIQAGIRIGNNLNRILGTLRYIQDIIPIACPSFFSPLIFRKKKSKKRSNQGFRKKRDLYFWNFGFLKFWFMEKLDEKFYFLYWFFTSRFSTKIFDRISVNIKNLKII